VASRAFIPAPPRLHLRRDFCSPPEASDQRQSEPVESRPGTDSDTGEHVLYFSNQEKHIERGGCRRAAICSNHIGTRQLRGCYRMPELDELFMGQLRLAPGANGKLSGRL
jgi:hypothetical protein